MQGAFGAPKLVVGVALAALTGVIIFGGLRQIARVAELVVPFMAGAYLLAQIVSAAAVYLCAKHYFSFTLAGPALRTLSVGMLAVAVAAWALSQPADWPWRYAKGATVLLLWLALAWTEPRFRELAAATWNRLLRSEKAS